MKNLRKALALLLALCMVMALAACTGDTPPAGSQAPGGGVSLKLWTYPIGYWKDEAEVKAITDAFTAQTGIPVTMEYLDYSTGDDRVNGALTADEGPDLIMEGPERLVANWGANGYLVDLIDLIDNDARDEISDAVLAACINDAGQCYEYPLVMTAHCMAVNLDAFKAAGADQYLDLENHTWTTENFIKAMEAMYDHYGVSVGAVFCGGQGGDQGTRALVNNLYGGAFTNAEHTRYTWDDPKNVQALEKLYELDAIDFDPSLIGGDEIREFYNGTLKMAFCWNIGQQLNPNEADTGAGKTADGEEIVCMSFPSETGESLLQGGIWGFGVVDNGDQARIDAAKEFIRFVCDSQHTVDAVKTARYFPVRYAAGDGVDLTNVWADNEIMGEYNKLMPYLGDYYQITTGWAQARTEWWNMLQEVGSGSDVASTVARFCANANAAAAG